MTDDERTEPIDPEADKDESTAGDEAPEIKEPKDEGKAEKEEKDA